MLIYLKGAQAWKFQILSEGDKEIEELKQQNIELIAKKGFFENG